MRKDFISNQVVRLRQACGRNKVPVVWICRLVLKQGCDNFHTSATRGGIKAKGIDVIVYKPAIKEMRYFRSVVVNDLASFTQESDVIIANRRSSDLGDASGKIYTRDLFSYD